MRAQSRNDRLMAAPEPVLELFAPGTAEWFRKNIGTPTAVQREGWPAIASGRHVLISAPTGTGKTLSAFLLALDRLKVRSERGELRDETEILYISPLKSLGNDIRENLRKPLEGLGCTGVRVGIRTGDTPQSERQRMIKKPPHILITTPESLYLLLTSIGGQKILATVKTVILDELHALINGKRGAHMMLSLARLEKLCGTPPQRVGLSATIEPLDLAAEYLAGGDPVEIVAPKMHKEIRLEINSPITDAKILPEMSVWPEIARMVYYSCEGMRTVIAFVENRAQAERLAFAVNAVAGEGFARTHHGCVSKDQRMEAEQQLRSGELRLLCATSSMELGIDVGEVDLVLQVGCPRSVSSTMQRLGRAGHNPGRTSEMRMFPRTAAESIFCGMTAKIALRGGIEQSRPPRKCLDVLAQHMVSMATGDGYTVDEALALLKRAYNFREVTREELLHVLQMLAGDYEHALDHPARPRILYDRIHGTVRGDAYSRMLAQSAGGTIPDRGMYAAKLADGTRLGELEEEFVTEARVGNKFLLGSFAWKITAIQRDQVIVTPTSTAGALPPFWRGDPTGRSYRTGLAFGAMLRGLMNAHEQGDIVQALRDLQMDEPAARNAAAFLHRQIMSTGTLPDDRTIIVEHFSDRTGENQMMVHSIFGKRINAGLALLAQEAASRINGMDVSSYDDDDGFLLYSHREGGAFPDGLLHEIRPETARGLITKLLPKTPVFNITFRYNAGRALMMGVRNGRRVPLWVQRLRSSEVLENAVMQREHPLIRETERECLEDNWDLAALEDVLHKIHAGEITVLELRMDHPSPMSLPLRRQVETDQVYNYTPTPTRVIKSVEKELGAGEMLPPEPETLRKLTERTRKPEDHHQLHGIMMTEGDLIAEDFEPGELEQAMCWLERLRAEERALYIEPGLWICAEQEELYRGAFSEEDPENGAARQKIVRRCLRYRGEQNAASLSDRYFWPEEQSLVILRALAESGAAIERDGVFYHAELYQRAQRETVFQRRKYAVTLPPERLAALLAQRESQSSQTLEQCMSKLSGELLPPPLWESVIFPARVRNFSPALLDRLLAQGEWFWQIAGADRPLLGFFPHDAVDWDREPLADGAVLDGDEAAVAEALSKRGASFSQSLVVALGGRSPLETLFSLAEKGLVRTDSFLPVRQWMEREKTEQFSQKRRARARAKTLSAGRWELTRPLAQVPIERQIQLAFERTVLLCRETVGSMNWPQALEALRVMEYTGQVRRGYFIQGLSGAQFIRDADYRSVCHAMENPRDEIIWLNAADPAQSWGKILPHDPARAFVCVPGTAVALYKGRVAAVMERQGAVLRIFEPKLAEQTLCAFAESFTSRRIFPARAQITIKQYPKEAESALKKAGFSQQMLDYILWQTKV